MSATPSLEPGATFRVTIQAEVPYDAPSAFLRAQGAAKRALDDPLTSTETGEPELKRARREFTVPEVEIQVLAPDGGLQSFFIPKNALYLLSPRFKKMTSDSLLLEGPEDRPFIHSAAVEHILQFARLKSGYIEKKDFPSLASIKLAHPAAFEKIFYDVVWLCRHFEIHDLTQWCVVFIAEEFHWNPTAHLPVYLRWAERFDQRDFIKVVFKAIHLNKPLRLKLYPVLASLMPAEASSSMARLVQQCFHELLPQDAEGEEIIQISRCYMALFPRCEASKGVHTKIASYDMGAIRDPSIQLGDFTLAFYIVGLSKGFAGKTQELNLLYSMHKDKRLNELHMLLASVFSKTEERVARLRLFHTVNPENICAMQMLCHLYLAENNTPACLELVERILLLKADYTPAILARGECHFARGNLEAAAQDAQLAYEIDPTDITTYLVRAKYKYLKNEFDSAIQGCTELIQNNPRDLLAWYLRGLCLMNKGELDFALSDMKQALLLSPTHVDILSDIGRIYLAKSFLDASLHYLNLAAAQPGHHFWTLRARGECLLKRGDPREAISDFTRALALTKEPAPMTYALRAQSNIQIGNLPGAQHDIDTALGIDPQCVLALQLKAQLASELHQVTDALDA